MTNRKVSIFDRMRGFQSDAERDAFMKGVSEEREKIAKERVEMARKRGMEAARKKGTGFGFNPEAAQNLIGNIGGQIEKSSQNASPGPAAKKRKSPIDSITDMIVG